MFFVSVIGHDLVALEDGGTLQSFLRAAADHLAGSVLVRFSCGHPRQVGLCLGVGLLVLARKGAHIPRTLVVAFSELFHLRGRVVGH